MSNFPVLTTDSAPSSSKNLLQKTRNNFGFIPNLIGIMATSPSLTEAYLTVAGIFSKSDLSATEQQIVLLTVSRYHECYYCMTVHTAIANMKNVAPDIVEAIRTDQTISDSKLEALRQFTWLVIEKRGWVDEIDLQTFLNAGYESKHVLDLLVGVAQKTMSNFTNHIAKTPLDEAFAEVAWKAS